ncbi:MAG TPA: hypothetical protein VGH86_12790 [Phenylobacterium sp.]|jgi:hypothetical protein
MAQSITRRGWVGAVALAAVAAAVEAEPQTAMTNRAHFLARPEYREALVRCFSELLGCGPPMALPASGPLGPIVAFRFPGGGAVSVEFTESALGHRQARRGAWLELKPADPDALEAAVKAAGLPQVSYPATTTFYFAVPGGQVFGIARADRAELKP